MTFHADELDNLLSEKLRLITPTPARNPEIARQRRNEYINQAKYLQFGKPVFAVAGLLKGKPRLRSFSQRPSLVPFAAAILLIFGLVFGSVGTVYAAQDSLPNDLLYSVKLTGENLQLAFTSDTDARISLLTTFVGHRAEEATALALLGQPIPEELPDLMDEHLDELFTLTARMDEFSQQEALKGIQIHLRDQDQDMTNAMNGLPDGLNPQLVQLREMLKERQQLAQMGLEESNTLQQQFRHQQRKPATPITSTLTTTITTTVITTPEITVTLTITPGQYGPGPCEIPGACTPAGHTYGPGPFEGTSPVPEDHEGYGPGPLQPPDNPKPEDDQEPPIRGSENGSSNDDGKEGSDSQKNKP